MMDSHATKGSEWFADYSCSMNSSSELTPENVSSTTTPRRYHPSAEAGNIYPQYLPNLDLHLCYDRFGRPYYVHIGEKLVNKSHKDQPSKIRGSSSIGDNECPQSTSGYTFSSLIELFGRLYRKFGGQAVNWRLSETGIDGGVQVEVLPDRMTDSDEMKSRTMSDMLSTTPKGSDESSTVPRTRLSSKMPVNEYMKYALDSHKRYPDGEVKEKQSENGKFSHTCLKYTGKAPTIHHKTHDFVPQTCDVYSGSGQYNANTITARTTLDDDISVIQSTNDMKRSDHQCFTAPRPQQNKFVSNVDKRAKTTHEERYLSAKGIQGEAPVGEPRRFRYVNTCTPEAAPVSQPRRFRYVNTGGRPDTVIEPLGEDASLQIVCED